MGSKIQKVANIFGLELGEYFKLKGYTSVFYFSETGLKSLDKKVRKNLPNILAGMLLDHYGIQKLAWKPSVGEGYYVPNLLTETSTQGSTWIGFPSHLDRVIYERGLVCKTEEEALKLADIMLDVVKKYREEN